MSEKAFQTHVVKALRGRGWIVWTVPNMRRTTAGLPDVLAVHPNGLCLLAFELKTVKGRVRAAQTQAIKCLSKVPGVYAAIVRPTDWPELLKELDYR